MKISIDTSVITQLTQTYGDKAPQVLWNALVNHQEKVDTFDGIMNPLDYEEIVRRQKISQRLSVAQMENARDVLAHLNRETGKAFKMLDTNLKPIAILLRTYEKKELIQVIDNKVAKWKGTSMEDYLRPSTLFRPSNFEAYANESVAPEVQEKNFGEELDAMLGGGK